MSAVTYDGDRRQRQAGLKGSRHRTETISQGISIFIPSVSEGEGRTARRNQRRVAMMKAASTCCSCCNAVWFSFRRDTFDLGGGQGGRQRLNRYLLAAPLPLALFLGVVSVGMRKIPRSLGGWKRNTPPSPHQRHDYFINLALIKDGEP